MKEGMVTMPQRSRQRTTGEEEEEDDDEDDDERDGSTGDDDDHDDDDSGQGKGNVMQTPSRSQGKSPKNQGDDGPGKGLDARLLSNVRH